MSKARKLIDELIEKKAQGNEFQVTNVKMKLLFKGVNSEKITDKTEDSDELIKKIQEVAQDFNVVLTV